MRFFCLIVVFCCLAEGLRAAGEWPQFRGPGQEGHGEARGLPLFWSETNNVKWKTPIPGRAWSCPVVWDDQVWVTTAPEDGHELFAVGLDRGTGRILHNVKVFDVDNQQKMNGLNSFASPTPVIEAGRVYVHFGTYGTACLATGSGEILWTRRDLNLEHEEGPGSSPVLFENLLIFHCDGTNVQYVAALDKMTGKTGWKDDRSRDLSRVTPHKRKGFSTPLLIPVEGTTQMISVGAQAVYGYEPRTGAEIWRLDFDGFTVAPRPVSGLGMVFITTGFDSASLLGIRLGGHGDVTESNLVWRYGKQVPYRSSPILVDDLLYMVSDGGIASCVEARTGTLVWSHRFGGNEGYSASPIYADGRLYFFGQRGKTTVLKPGRDYEELAVNQLDSGFMASPAVAGRALYLRTEKALYRVEQ
jgi:outer membrane protein assembly factor BamB